MNKAIRGWSFFQMITMGFFSVIMLGALFLTLPISTVDGRVGGLTLVFTALNNKKKVVVSKLPQERIMVG